MFHVEFINEQKNERQYLKLLVTFPSGRALCASSQGDSYTIYPDNKTARRDLYAIAAERGRTILTGPAMLRTFALERAYDISGVSGEGTVAYGVQFINGQVFLEWCSDPQALSLYPSLSAVMQVHGHGGATTFQILEGNQS